MLFVDEATIEVAAGDGGYGLISFRREAKVPLGGPDGGQGGDGGDVVLEASEGVTTLLDHRYKRFYRAESGKPGGSSNKTGRDGESAVIPLPVGTVVTDVATGEVLADLHAPGERVVVAKGGRGGRGNSSFATATRQTPRYSQEGTPGEARVLSLSLKLVADVGLVGLPNAGKSTFIRAVTRSQARVAAYPFTTLVPNLGVYRLGERDIIVADVPGLIEGAHEGQGLGDRFLKHLERTQVLVHLVSLSPDAVEPVEAYRIVRRELSEWSGELARMPEIVVLNKVDLVGDPAELALWRAEFEGIGVAVMTSSGLSGESVHDVMRRAALLLAPKQDPHEGGWSPI